VEQSTAAALVYRRVGPGFERETYTGPTAVIPLPEIRCRPALADLYEHVPFRSPGSDGVEEA